MKIIDCWGGGEKGKAGAYYSNVGERWWWLEPKFTCLFIYPFISLFILSRSMQHCLCVTPSMAIHPFPLSLSDLFNYLYCFWTNLYQLHIQHYARCWSIGVYSSGTLALAGETGCTHWRSPVSYKTEQALASKRWIVSVLQYSRLRSSDLSWETLGRHNRCSRCYNKSCVLRGWN